LHEIGHLLGLAAHSETRGDVMYADYRGMGRQLSRNDVAAMRRLYGLGPR
jgi:predicted Zn-dependent protease